MCSQKIVSAKVATSSCLHLPAVTNGPVLPSLIPIYQVYHNCPLGVGKRSMAKEEREIGYLPSVAFFRVMSGKRKQNTFSLKGKNNILPIS